VIGLAVPFIQCLSDLGDKCGISSTPCGLY
jgi:hypothetical protein